MEYLRRPAGDIRVANNPPRATEVCNLSTERGSSVHEVIVSVEQALGRVVPKFYRERRAGDPPHRVVDVTRAKEQFAWQPNTTLDVMVESALVWHQSELYQQAVSGGGMFLSCLFLLQSMPSRQKVTRTFLMTYNAL
jgi:hypothetical protein